MSWFSNRFSASFKAPEGLHGHGDGDVDVEQDDEQISQGKGVKEDLSELTKSFTRQLWGVASFLAPPPTTKDQVDPPSPSPSDHHVQPDLQIDSFSQSDDTALSNELVDVDFEASIDPAEVTQEGASHRPSISGQWQTPADDVNLPLHQSSDHRLTGIGKDLAELKGSVAVGFSRILKVVREEIDRNEHAKQKRDHDDDEDDDDDYDNDDEDKSESSVHARRLPMFNSLLKPLLSGILLDEMLKKRTPDDDDEDEEGFDDDPADVRGHQMSRPPVAPLNLQRTLGESLGGISKLASSLFPVSLDSDDEYDTTETNQVREGVGVTEEVLAFAKNISMHPETWLDFPLFTDDDEDDDFEMSNAQKEHIHEVEFASPRLAALRIELCPDYMSEGRFWKIYFVLLHSRLSKKDALLLSTPQIMEARALLLNNLQKKEIQKNVAEEDGQSEREGKDSERLLTPGSEQSFKIVSLQSAMEVPAKDFDQIENLGANQGRPQTSGQITTDTVEEVQNKNVLASTVKLATLNYEEEEADADRWLHEESSPHLGSATAAGLGNEDDVSFSDLEEDDDSLMSKGVGSSKLKESHGWVQLNEDKEAQEFERLGFASRSKLDGERQALATQKHDRREPNDWLTVEEDDVDSSDFA
eukprot:c23239_g1_i1 orf=155-2080(+)